TVPHVPVGPANALGLDLDDRLARSRRRIGEVGQLQRPAPLDQPGRLHARACSAAIGDSSRACWTCVTRGRVPLQDIARGLTLKVGVPGAVCQSLPYGGRISWQPLPNW